MARRLRITGDGAEALVELNGGSVPNELWSRLPFETKTKVEGGELRFEVMVPSGAEAADRLDVGKGDVAYWPEGNALCVFLDGVDEARVEKFTKVGAVVEGLDTLRGVRTHRTLRLEEG